jgi:hypothetical protein
MSELIYQEKYLKYKQKYLELISKLKYISSENNNQEINNYIEHILVGGKGKKKKVNKFKNNLSNNNSEYVRSERFNCEPENKFSEICSSNIKGYYNSKSSCMNDCENKYIKYNLKKANIFAETSIYNNFISTLFSKKYEVYLKGGTVIGLYLLKLLYDKYSNDYTIFEKYFNDLLKLDLIKDWDFTCYTHKVIDDILEKDLAIIAKKNHLVRRGKTFILYQTEYPIKVNDAALFEISIMEDEIFSNLELPLTTMKIKINKKNLNHIFMFAKCFYSYKVKNIPIDIDVIKHMTSNLHFFIYPNKNGLFSINKDNFNVGSLNNNIVEFIKKFSYNIYKEQFLITHIQEPNRIFYRLLEKNIPKVEKIIFFLNKHDLPSNQSWLFDTKSIEKLISSFIINLGIKIIDIFNEQANPIDGLNAVTDFLDGVNLKRIEIEYLNTGEKGKNLIKKLFSKIYNKIPDDFYYKYKDNKIIECLTFLKKKKLLK